MFDMPRAHTVEVGIFRNWVFPKVLLAKVVAGRTKPLAARKTKSHEHSAHQKTFSYSSVTRANFDAPPAISYLPDDFLRAKVSSEHSVPSPCSKGDCTGGQSATTVNDNGSTVTVTSNFQWMQHTNTALKGPPFVINSMFSRGPR